MDIDSHVTHRKCSENDLLWRHNRKLSLEINRIQSIQDVLVKNIDKKMNTVQREIKYFGYSEEKKKSIATEKFPIYLPFWREWKFSGLKRQTDVSQTKEINISKLDKANVSLKDKIRSFIENMSRSEDKPFTNSELVAQDIAQDETNERLLSVNPGAVGMDSNTASEVIAQEKLAALGATDDDKQVENINKNAGDTFEWKSNESMRRTSSLALSSGRQSVALQSQVDSNTLLLVLPSIDCLDVAVGGSTTQKSDRFCPGITKKPFYTSEFNLQDITKNQYIIQSDYNTVSSVNDKMDSKKNTQRRSSIAVSPKELNILFEKELKIKENNEHLSQVSGQTTRTTRRYSVLPNLDKFYEAHQSDDNVFRVSSQSVRSETEASDIHKGNKKPEYKMRKPMTKAPVLDRDIYNADGSLRAVYCLPSLEESWIQARRAHYIRSKYSIDKELSIEEIFSAIDNEDIEESDTNTVP